MGGQESNAKEVKLSLDDSRDTTWPLCAGVVEWNTLSP
jgi:hypothetical protein